MSIDKKDPVKDDNSEESLGSSPEGEQQPQQNSNNTQETQENQQPKRKGGRKPIYATSEERKQRNRQAQAAFRERRTEYIKQLEEAIRVHEQNLHQLQAAHRNAADECLMLRYKNSLLERILLEKGIDVQAELRAKTGSPNLGPTHMPQNLVQPPPISRSLLGRHHSRRSNSSIAPKLEQPDLSGTTALHPPLGGASAMSPKGRHAVSSSHSASPTTTVSVFGGGSPAASGSDHITPPAARAPALGLKQQQQPTAPMAHMNGMPATGPPRTMQQQMQAAAQRHSMQRAAAGGAHGGVVTTTAAPFYTPAFQSHIDQLGKLPRPDNSHFPPPIELCSPRFISHAHGQQQSGAGGGAYPAIIDPGLDWGDPFGLSASMAFPTQFSFDTSNMR
ncbi:hypothetical protein MAPG_03349 [Magnaporthiopsis poae ATCC 64411]|uniref:BZIP domain-containing protein n=1 Tax=Magnaporthiopsis poae (strain ATCC 64411 / 73-15) TaxID=644358 RepID=A0A0C4DTS6_MAGP6|nr:hypothetical protein MAPG_03349 [Magnaporthiopsis poae ATCC 64411]